jgi:sugar phosphate isomerase/epimerase
MEEAASSVVVRMLSRGVSNIEVSSFHPFEEGLEDILLWHAGNGDARILVHNYAPPTRGGMLINLCSADGAVRDATRAFVRERIDLTKRIGADYYSFHAGFRVEYSVGVHQYATRTGHEEALSTFIEEVASLADYAAGQGVHLGVENHVAIRENRDNLILYDIPDWERLLDEVRSPFLHLHLDVGHLKISANEHGFDRGRFIELFGDRVMGVHFNDNTGMKVDCSAPFSSDFWFGAEEFSHMPDLRYLILETRSFGDMEVLKGMVSELRGRMAP